MKRVTFAAIMLVCLLNGAQAAHEKSSAYLMAYFGPAEKLLYAVSDDARHWHALNSGKPVFDPGARLRDPFVNRVNDTFHLVHTKGWDHPTIFHWQSTHPPCAIASSLVGPMFLGAPAKDLPRDKTSPFAARRAGP